MFSYTCKNLFTYLVIMYFCWPVNKTYFFCIKIQYDLFMYLIFTYLHLHAKKTCQIWHAKLFTYYLITCMFLMYLFVCNRFCMYLFIHVISFYIFLLHVLLFKLKIWWQSKTMLTCWIFFTCIFHMSTKRMIKRITVICLHVRICLQVQEIYYANYCMFCLLHVKKIHAWLFYMYLFTWSCFTCNLLYMYFCTCFFTSKLVFM